MSMFKVGDRVKMIDTSRVYHFNDWERNKHLNARITRVDGGTYSVEWENGQSSYLLTTNELQLITKSKTMKPTKNKTKKPTAKYKVGETVTNEDECQKSKILEIYWDDYLEGWVYVVKCLEDSGSLHLVEESDLSEIETVNMTVEELKEYYEENESVEVKIKK